MDKFSIYELLSFLVPGFISLYLINDFIFHLTSYEYLFTWSGYEENLMIAILSLIIGLTIHYILTPFLLKIKFLEKLLIPSIQSIKYNPFIKSIIPFLNETYKSDKKHSAKFYEKDDVPAENLFDFAYFYLESNQKIAPTKNFQSIYFFIKNMFTIVLIVSLVSLTMLIWHLISPLSTDEFNYLVKTLLYSTIGIVLTVKLSKIIRTKMAERVFGNFYLELIYNLKKLNNDRK